MCTKFFSLPKNSLLYAWREEDLFLCKDGYGLLVGNSESEPLNPFSFQSGQYSCGSKNGIKSLRAGATCKSERDCPSNVNGTYAQCECSYSSTDKVCGILQENAEFTDYLLSVSTPHLTSPFRSKTLCKRLNTATMLAPSSAPCQMMPLTTSTLMVLATRKPPTKT